VAEEADEPAGRPTEDDWSPPRELLALAAGFIALASAALVLLGGSKKWTSPTLGVLLLVGGAESLVAIGIIVKAALAARRGRTFFVPAIVVTALGTTVLAGLLLLSGIV
jgi:hypothetical protein